MMLKDREIREPLFEFLDETFGKIRILEEKTMGNSRADVVMVMEGLLVGIEIKSDADTYERLERQVKDYNSFFDCNIVAVGTSHARHIGEHVPDWWGIITVEEVDGRADFYYYRKMRPNPKAVDRKRQLGFLWRPELAHIQEQNKMAKYREKSKRFVMEKILEQVDPDVLKIQICSELFERDYTEIGEKIAAYRAARPKKGGASKQQAQERKASGVTGYTS